MREPPTVLRRVAAGIIDFIVVFVVLGIVALDFILSGSIESLVYTAVVYAIYEIIAWRAFGTTLGKWAMALKVTNSRGANPNFVEGLTRYCVRNLEPIITVVAAAGVAIVADLTNVVALAWTVFILITIHRSADRRGLHDRASGCTVTWSR